MWTVYELAVSVLPDGSFFLCFVTGSFVFWDFGSLFRPSCNVQSAGITFQLSPLRAVGGMSGLTSHARTRVLVDENGAVSGGVVASVSTLGFW